MNDKEKEILLLEQLIERLTEKLNSIKNCNEDEYFVIRATN